MEFRWFGQPNPTDANENTAICDLLTKLICFTTTWVDWLKGHLEYVRLQYYKYLKASVLVTARCLFAITVTRHLQSSESITFSILQSTVTPSLSVYCDSIALSLLWLHRPQSTVTPSPSWTTTCDSPSLSVYMLTSIALSLLWLHLSQSTVTPSLSVYCNTLSLLSPQSTEIRHSLRRNKQPIAYYCLQRCIHVEQTHWSNESLVCESRFAQYTSHVCFTAHTVIFTCVLIIVALHWQSNMILTRFMRPFRVCGIHVWSHHLSQPKWLFPRMHCAYSTCCNKELIAADVS